MLAPVSVALKFGFLLVLRGVVRVLPIADARS